MEEHSFDLVVIGAGPGGYVAAIRAAQLGLKVACIEKENALGGTCLRVGCIPSKALLEASHHYSDAQNKLSGFGIMTGGVSLDLEVMMQHKSTTVSTLTKGIAGLFRKNKVSHYQGLGTIQAAGQVAVTDASGSRRIADAPRSLGRVEYSARKKCSVVPGGRVPTTSSASACRPSSLRSPGGSLSTRETMPIQRAVRTGPLPVANDSVIRSPSGAVISTSMFVWFQRRILGWFFKML